MSDVYQRYVEWMAREPAANTPQHLMWQAEGCELFSSEELAEIWQPKRLH